MIPAGVISYSASAGSPYGPELIGNTDFATDTWWSKGSDWTISGGTANSSGVSGADLNSPLAYLTSGTTYKVEFDITASNGVGGMNVRIGSGYAPRYAATAVGHYSFEGTEAGYAKFYITSIIGWVGKIDNVSVKEVL